MDPRKSSRPGATPSELINNSAAFIMQLRVRACAPMPDPWQPGGTPPCHCTGKRASSTHARRKHATTRPLTLMTPRVGSPQAPRSAQSRRHVEAPTDEWLQLSGTISMLAETDLIALDEDLRDVRWDLVDEEQQQRHQCLSPLAALGARAPPDAPCCARHLLRTSTCLGCGAQAR